MQINQEGLELLKSCEGCKLKAYPDPGTGGAPWTIGYGHTGDDIASDITITQEEADSLLKQDLERFERGVERLLKVKVTENQFSALVCFAYNVGLENLRVSLLLRCINSYHPEDAGGQFLRWNKAGGKVLPGLTLRRQKERDLFLKA